MVLEIVVLIFQFCTDLTLRRKNNYPKKTLKLLCFFFSHRIWPLISPPNLYGIRFVCSLLAL
jgi:hypothetical protein